MLVEQPTKSSTRSRPLAARLGASCANGFTSLRRRPHRRPLRLVIPSIGALLAALGHEAQSIDALAERTGIGVPALSSMLLELELEGEVASERGGSMCGRRPIRC